MDRSRSMLIALVVAVGAAAFLSSFGLREQVLVERELALAFTLRVIGSMVAVIGLVGVLGQWYSGAPVSRLAPGGVVILAGVLVASQTWSAALGLGVAVAVAIWVQQPAPPHASNRDATPSA